MNARRSRKQPLLTVTSSALLAFAAWSSPASAQPIAPGFALNRFEPSETGSEWFMLDTLDIHGVARPALGVVADYGYRPYVLLNPDGSDNRRIVIGQFFVHAGASLVLFDRLRIGVSLPIEAGQNGSRHGGVVNGERVVVNTGSGIGDLRAALDLRLVGEYGGPFSLALGGRIWFPTGDQEKYLSDNNLRVGPHLSAAGDLGGFAYAATVGVTYRGNDRAFAGHPMGSEANFGLALGAHVLDKKLMIGPELVGTSVISDSNAFFGERTTPLALIGGLHYTAGDIRLGLGGGPGLSHAAGTAAFRGLASLEYVPGLPAPAAPPPSESDRDGDGVVDRFDACPELRGIATADPATNGCPPDRDKDAIVDADDACPDVAGVRTDDPKTNGCPPDRDQDGVVDTFDACPDVPGVKTDDPSTNGCPPDRDKDGIVDASDACPEVPGVKTDDPKTNGCPPDRDGDKIVDSEDACPDEAGKPNQDPKKNGCPAAYIRDNQIRITEQVKFRTGKAILDPISDVILDAVFQVIQSHTDIAKLRIEGHTDNKGSAQLNKRLSEARALAVVNWLTKHGIPRAKLSNVGFGMTKPIDSNETEEGRANNRRVEFHIEGEGAPKPAKPPAK
jgi:OOP family OmpA-OmpF porin